MAAAFHWTQRQSVWEDNDAQTHPVQAGMADSPANPPGQVRRSHSAAEQKQQRHALPLRNITRSPFQRGEHTKGDQLP